MTGRKEIISIPIFLRDLQDPLDVYPMGYACKRHLTLLVHSNHQDQENFWTHPNPLLAYAQLLSMETPLLSHILVRIWDLARRHTWKHELRNIQGYWPSKCALTASWGSEGDMEILCVLPCCSNHTAKRKHCPEGNKSLGLAGTKGREACP